MFTKTVIRIAVVLALAGAGIYFGFIYSWTAQKNAADAAARPVKALKRFDTSNAIIPEDRIVSGGPAPDGIPGIDNPRFVTVSTVDFLREKDEVVVYSVGDQPLAVTYCPLSGTAMVFDRKLDGEVLAFGISGLLYNSGVLLFDNGRAKAYPIESLAAVKQIDDALDQTKISVSYDSESRLAVVANRETGEPIPSVRS